MVSIVKVEHSIALASSSRFAGDDAPLVEKIPLTAGEEMFWDEQEKRTVLVREFGDMVLYRGSVGAFRHTFSRVVENPTIHAKTFSRDICVVEIECVVSGDFKRTTMPRWRPYYDGSGYAMGRRNDPLRVSSIFFSVSNRGNKCPVEFVVVGTVVS